MNIDHINRVLKVLFRIFGRIEIVGMENIPKDGGVLLTINHLSWVDSAFVFVNVRPKRHELSALVAKKYQSSAFFRWLVNQVPGIWIDRENPDLQAIREATKYLQNGGVLGIAPEGTRSKTAQLLPAKPGVVFLATRAKVPIVPTAITGTENVVRDLSRLRRPHLTLTFGAPMMLPPIDRKRRDESLQENADEIMCQVAALLPESYRGHYANHPRLRELLRTEENHPTK